MKARMMKYNTILYIHEQRFGITYIRISRVSTTEKVV